MMRSTRCVLVIQCYCTRKRRMDTSSPSYQGNIKILCHKAGIYLLLPICSDQHNSVALFKVDSFKDPNLPNVHCKLAWPARPSTLC